MALGNGVWDKREEDTSPYNWVCKDKLGWDTLRYKLDKRKGRQETLLLFFLPLPLLCCLPLLLVLLLEVRKQEAVGETEPAAWRGWRTLGDPLQQVLSFLEKDLQLGPHLAGLGHELGSRKRDRRDRWRVDLHRRSPLLFSALLLVHCLDDAVVGV